ncbi:MAG: hypothetical protein ACYTFG_14180 [Planctomycetota bacterium]|jgi:hypothetical protein
MYTLARYSSGRGISRLIEAIQEGEIWPWFVIAGVVPLFFIIYMVKRSRRGQG